jgi:NADH-quinone oxidoreductase subunit M
LSNTERFWLLMAFLAGFAVKVPLFPVHTWLPLAHTEAPTAGSVILAGVLLKLGTYGLLKLALPIASPDAIGLFAPYIGTLCVIGVIYGALVAWVQQDIKKLVAYSSVSHLGFCVLGLFALNTIGVQGSVLYMINHGLSTGALFLVIGMIYDRYHTRDIKQLSGLARVMPKMAFFFILFTLSSIGLPGLNGFVSEFLTILGAFTSEHLGISYGAFAALGIILGAVYMLHMAQSVIFGPLKVPAHEEHDENHLPRDIGAREMTILVPIALCVVILGVYPNVILKTIEQPAMAVTQIAPAAPVIERRVARTSPAGQRPAPPSPRQTNQLPSTRSAR